MTPSSGIDTRGARAEVRIFGDIDEAGGVDTKLNPNIRSGENHDLVAKETEPDELTGKETPDADRRCAKRERYCGQQNEQAAFHVSTLIALAGIVPHSGQRSRVA